MSFSEIPERQKRQTTVLSAVKAMLILVIAGFVLMLISNF